MTDAHRTYSEKEIAALLKRTAQLQAEEVEAADENRSGLSLSELESIAGEAGLDPQFLHRAALELEHAAGKPLGKNKTKTHVRVDRVLPSTLTDDEWEEVVFALKRRFESQSYDMGLGMGSYGKGTMEQIGRSREWRHTSLSGVQTTVLLRPHKKGTNMEISQRVGFGSTKTESWAYGLPFAMMFALITGAVFKSALIGLAAMIGWTALLVPLTHYLDTRWREKKHNALVELADELEHIVMMDSGSYVSSRRENLRAEGKTHYGSGAVKVEPENAAQPDQPEGQVLLPDDEVHEGSNPSGTARSRTS